MMKPASKIPQKAHFDRKRVETVHCSTTSLPTLSTEQLAMVCRIDSERRAKATQEQSKGKFLAKLEDETCSMCQPPETKLDKYRIPCEWRHMPWDEIELKKHSLLDRKCHHFGNAPPPDEIEMKKLGLVDSECHHRSKQLDEAAKKKAAEMAKQAHQRLEMVCQRNKGVLECKLKQPHIKISPTVEVVDDDEPADEPSFDSSDTMLTAHLSAKNTSSGKEISSQEQAPSATSERAAFQPPASLSNPKVDVSVQGIPGNVIGSQSVPVVMSKTFETADGQFEFNINFEVRFKPKPKEGAPETVP